MSSDPQSHQPDTEVKPLASMHKMLGAGLLALFLAWGLMGSGDVTMFIDQNSLILVVGITYAALWMCFGPLTIFRVIRDALFGGAGVSAARRSRGIAVLARGHQLAWASGLSGSLVGLVIMLSNLDDPHALGPGFAVMLLTTFYGLILAELIFNPLKQMLMSGSGNTAPGAVEAAGVQGSSMPIAIIVVLLAGVGMMSLIASIYL